MQIQISQLLDYVIHSKTLKMRKILILSFLIGFSTAGFSQNLLSEYRYLALVKTQPKQLIKDNLRNAEIIADSLMFSGTKDNQTASLFFMELGNNYSIVNKHELAIFSYLRQRFCFPNDIIRLNVEKQIRLNAMHLNIDNQIIDNLILKSAPYNLSENAATNLNSLIYWISKIETKNLTPLLLHQIDLMKANGIAQIDYLLKWEDISRIAIPLKYKPDYLYNDFNNLDSKQKQFYYKAQLRYFLKHKAWKSAEISLSEINKLNTDKPKSLWYLKLRAKWHF
jgi:hypothetical protein